MRKGFTLIEMLIVISIIVLLAGLILPAVFRAKGRAKIIKTQAFITQLDVALGEYIDFERNSDYPPTSLKDMGFASNGINDGIESLMACLASKESGDAPYFVPPDENIGNLDKDKIPDSFNNDRGVGTNEAYEFIDPYGNPYVYIHWKDYDSNDSKKLKYRLRDGKFAQVKASRSKVTKNFHNQHKYQIWSFGPNGKNENGEGDDICNWAKKKEKKK